MFRISSRLPLTGAVAPLSIEKLLRVRERPLAKSEQRAVCEAGAQP
ncbi:hypothetical protein [Streptomyces sp. NPDC051162]